MAKATVTGVDDYRWAEDGAILSAALGDDIDVSDDELARGLEIGALSLPADAASDDEKPLDKMTVAELRSLAELHGLDVPEKAKKPDLIALIEEAQDAATVEPAEDEPEPAAETVEPAEDEPAAEPAAE